MFCKNVLVSHESTWSLCSLAVGHEGRGRECPEPDSHIRGPTDTSTLPIQELCDLGCVLQTLWAFGSHLLKQVEMTVTLIS